MVPNVKVYHRQDGVRSLESNSHRRACELAHMTIDNLGYAACFGDHPALILDSSTANVAVDSAPRGNVILAAESRRSHGRGSPVAAVVMARAPAHTAEWRITLDYQTA